MGGSTEVWFVLAILVLFGSARAFAMPASQAITPTCAHAALPNIVALNSSFSHVATVARLAVGAAIVCGILIFQPITRHVGRWLFLGAVIFGVALIVFGLSTSYLVSMVALPFLGVGDMISVYIHHLLVQLETPDHIRGRVSLLWRPNGNPCLTRI